MKYLMKFENFQDDIKHMMKRGLHAADRKLASLMIGSEQTESEESREGSESEEGSEYGEGREFGEGNESGEGSEGYEEDEENEY